MKRSVKSKMLSGFPGVAALIFVVSAERASRRIRF
jgi:hypothetical protein